MPHEYENDLEIINKYRDNYIQMFNEYLDKDCKLDCQTYWGYDSYSGKFDSRIPTCPPLDYYDLFITEIKKIKFFLYGKPLKLVENKLSLCHLINENGFIEFHVSSYYHRPLISNSIIQYTERELNYYPKDKDFGISLIIPLQILEHFSYELESSRIEIVFPHFEEQMKSVKTISLFDKYFTEFLRLYHRSSSWGELDTEKYKCQVIKRNYNLNLYESLNYLIQNKQISLFEYLICLELQLCNYEKNIILHSIFFSKIIGSFLSQKSNTLPLSSTSRQIFSENDLYLYVEKYINTKDEFYYLFNLKDFISSIKYDNLKDEYNLRALFDFREKNIITTNSILGVLISKNVRSNKYFFSSEDKLKFIKNYIIDNIDDNFLENNINQVLRNIENSLRIEKGLKIVGAYTNESILFIRLRDYFSHLEVVSQARPKWLGRQSLDIYIPEYKIGIEYQGIQHNEPVDFFGGKSAFKKRLVLDDRKKELCRLNNCVLIEVFPDYNFDVLCIQIISFITNYKK